MKRITAIGVFLAICLSASGTFAEMIYWTTCGCCELSGIWRANLDGTNLDHTPLVSNLTYPCTLALDLVHNKMYWGEGRFSDCRIRRANLDGSGVETVIRGIAEPNAIAIDANAGKIYWTKHGAGYGYVIRMNLDGTGVEIVVPAMEYQTPLGLALDLESGTIYWTESGYHCPCVIRRANLLDGSDAETILVSNIHSWFLCSDCIALDLPNSRIYWVDYWYHTAICRAHLDGSGDELMAWEPRPQFKIAIASCRRRIYHTRINEILYLDLDTGYVEYAFPESVARPYAIALDLRTTDGDCTGDGFTDLEDYACFMVSFTGPAKSISMGLECSDLNSDGHIDLADFAIFQNQFD